MRKRAGLGARLFAASVAVAVVALGAVWLVVSLVGPSIFHRHLRQATHHVDPSTSAHVEEAFADSTLISVTVGLLVALPAAGVVAALAARRIAAPVGRLAGAAHEVSTGDYATTVPSPHLGVEFEELTGAFNAMSRRLRDVEATRRRLLSDFAHEVRTPVATLDAYFEGAQDGLVTFDEPTVAMLRGQTARLARLADDVSAVSRAEEHGLRMDPQPVAPRALIDAAVAAARERFAAAGVELTGQVDPGVPAVRADTERLGQVLGNLLDNALRHTAAGGRVEVRGVAGGDAAVVTVTDTGDGIAAEHLPFLFERFYRTDAARTRGAGGSGIGLAIVKAVVEAHGGTVEAASDGPGCGATFTVTLPAA